MSDDSQRGPGSGGAANCGQPGAETRRQSPSGESPSGDGQGYAGTPRPDALIPALDDGQLAALREVGREWDNVCADPQVWRQALPVDPSLGEYPKLFRPHRFTRIVSVAGRDGQLPPIETTSVSETPLTPLGRGGQALKRLVFGPPLDATAIAVERMRKLVALPVLSADAPGRTAVILARQPSPRASPVTLVMCPGTPLRPTVGTAPKPPASPCLAGKAGRIWPVQAQDGRLRDYRGGVVPGRRRAQLGGAAAARASAQARASAASSTAASARSMAQAA